jgi:low affinity Fe/Cu permease
MDVLGMIVVEYLNPDIRQKMMGTRNEMVNSYILISVAFLICIFLLYHIKNKYEYAREQTFQMNKKLHLQARELKQLNDQLTSLNENLETTVAEKTDELEKHNQQLLSYAVRNLEKVTKPVNDILTLSSVEDLSEFPDSFDQIRMTARELDIEVRELNLKLEKEKLDKM